MCRPQYSLNYFQLKCLWLLENSYITNRISIHNRMQCKGHNWKCLTDIYLSITCQKGASNDKLPPCQTKVIMLYIFSWSYWIIRDLHCFVLDVFLEEGHVLIKWPSDWFLGLLGCLTWRCPILLSLNVDILFVHCSQVVPQFSNLWDLKMKKKRNCYRPKMTFWQCSI